MTQSQVSWIVTVAHNNLSLTQKAVESFLRQEEVGEIRVLVVNNASSDGTVEWLQFAQRHSNVEAIHFHPQFGVAHAWNRALGYLFRRGANHVLVCNNDVQLHPRTYTTLLGERSDFVTAVGYHSESAIHGTPNPAGVSDRRPHPDFSCFLISRRCWEVVGEFDEGFKIAFCEDWDYHVRMHLAGIEAYCIDMPFFHDHGGSQTIKRASDEEARLIQEQAARNREYFRSKWGFAGGSAEYYAFFRQPKSQRQLKSQSGAAGPETTEPATPPDTEPPDESGP